MSNIFLEEVQFIILHTELTQQLHYAKSGDTVTILLSSFQQALMATSDFFSHQKVLLGLLKDL